MGLTYPRRSEGTSVLLTFSRRVSTLARGQRAKEGSQQWTPLSAHKTGNAPEDQSRALPKVKGGVMSYYASIIPDSLDIEIASHRSNTLSSRPFTLREYKARIARPVRYAPGARQELVMSHA